MITLTSLTLGEILQKAGLNTLLGMGVVFTVLILISLLIYCLRFIPIFFEKMAGKKEEEKPAPAEKKNVPAAPAAVSPAAAVKSEEADLALIAVITAAIAAQADVPADGIVIRSIRRSTKNNWKHA